MKHINQKGFFITTIFIFIACAQNIKSINNYKSSLPFSTLSYKNIKIRIFEPNNDSLPTIWQGPICIAKNDTNFNCSFDLSLIKKIKIDSSNNSIKILIFTFSGSDEKLHIIDPIKCKIIQR